jgi:hypothetical protein
MAKLDLIDDPRVRDNYKATKVQGMRKCVALICPIHGFVKGEFCDECSKEAKTSTINIHTHDWVKGWWDHIDREPIYIESKEHLRRECEKRGLMARALMKPKSQGHGFEHRR